MNRPSPLLLLLSAAAFCGACALGPGAPAGELEPTFAARYVIPPDREAEGGASRLASDYRIRLTQARAVVTDLRLFAAGSGGGGAGGTFDPANPPPGYSLCHNGHCHRDDGALIPYAQIEAELAGGGGGATEELLAVLPVQSEVDLLAGMEQALECEPDCVLSQTVITRVGTGVTGLVLRGAVTDARTAAPRIPAELPFVLELALLPDASALAASAAVEVLVNRAQAPLIRVRAALLPGPSMFDAVDWAALQTQAGEVDFSLPQNQEAAAMVLSVFAESLEVEVER